jgi:type IV secretion system protein VirB6
MLAQFAESLIPNGDSSPNTVGVNPNWNKLANMVDSSNYTELFHNKHDGDWGMFVDIPLGSFAVFPWKVLVHGDRICVETMSFIGWMHVGCKYIAEPYPKSIYGSFFNNESYSTKLSDGNLKYAGYENAYIPEEMEDYLSCATSGGCAYRASAVSKASISISTTIIECIREMLTKLLISKQVCNIGDVKIGDGINRADSAFYQFQVNMQRTVMALLTLYVMFIGFKILLAGEELPKTGELIMYIVKLILVIYFSVGININGGTTRFDGMSSLVFPLLLGAASEIATWIMNATPSGLCRFLPSEYPADMGYIALWDSLDCKVLNYVGIDVITTMHQGHTSGDPLGNNIPPYLFLLIPAIYFGQMNLVLLAISYPLVVLSLAAYLVNSFAVCMIAISILGILAPIYVPMSLFKQTKGYFEGWYTLMISFVLQPVVVIGFMTLMFSLYDIGFYGTCKYVEMEIKVQDANKEIRTKKLFVVDNEKTHYESEEAYNGCKESLGWILNNSPGAIATGIAQRSGGGNTVDMSETPDSEQKIANYIKTFEVLSDIETVKGMFFWYSTYDNLSWSMIVNFMTCCLLLYLMYELSSQLGEFAADIAQSVTLSGVISPRGLADKAMMAVGAAGAAGKGGGGSGGSGGGSGGGAEGAGGASGAGGAGGAEGGGGGAPPRPNMGSSSTAGSQSNSTGGGGPGKGGLAPKSGESRVVEAVLKLDEGGSNSSDDSSDA